jgi:propionyl-CoA carboxylase alpha chain
MFYDPMIAKLVTYGDDRPAAITAMQEALDSFYIRGLGHNVPFLSALMAHPRFHAGRLTTGFIAEEFPEGFHGIDLRRRRRATWSRWRRWCTRPMPAARSPERRASRPPRRSPTASGW